jgi:hypothetical protein
MTKKTFNIWYHGHDGWLWSEDCKCYYYKPDWRPDPPSAYCLGNRYIHHEAGLDSYGIVWRGCTDDNWHGKNFGYDLGKAIRWVRAAAGKKLGCKLWSKYNKPFSPYDNDSKLQIVSKEDMEYLKGTPAPLKITIPGIFIEK